MKIEEITEDDKVLIKSIYTNGELSWDEKTHKLKNVFKVTSERAVRNWLVKLGFKERKTEEIEELKIAKKKILDKTKKRFLITSAQSSTPVNEGFLINLEAYAKKIDATILVIPFRYQNPTSVFTKEKGEDKEWWDSKIIKYLTLNRHRLNNGISVLSDVKIQPTSANPLQGLEGMTGEHSAVIGHPRLELRSIPVMEGCRPKILFTTGCCTVPNFTDSKIGKKGEFHFATGFAIVEVKDKETFFFRQVSASSKGEFIDLFYHVNEGKIMRENEVEAIALGDIHASYCDKRVTNITLNNLFKKLKPKKVFIHDIIDASSISHHNLNNPFILHKQEMSDTNSLEKEIDEMIKWLKPFEKYNMYIVKSNHDTHIDQFLQQNDWRRMPSFKNALPYMEYATVTLKGEAPNGIVPYIINKHYPKFKCLNYNDNVVVKGFLMSTHGHLGASGSRGSLQQYSRLSTKSVTGHSHTIGRIGGAVSVGTSSVLKMPYVRGASAWNQAHGIVNRLGKFQHIVFFPVGKNLEYTTLQ